MNALSIWAGTEYAYKPDSKRNERFSLDCFRVRVVRLRKELSKPGAKRSSTKVDVIFLNRDTGEQVEFKPTWTQQQYITENDDGTLAVKAFDVIEFWEQVDDHYKFLKKKQERERIEREQRYEQQRIEREEREKARIREQERIQLGIRLRTTKIQEFLVESGVKPEWIKRIDLYGSVVYMDLPIIEQAIEARENEPVPSSLFEKAMSS